MDKKRIETSAGSCNPTCCHHNRHKLVTAILRCTAFTLSGGEIVKSEQIQPVGGKVKVTGTADTDVVFTDIESGETYVIGYITSSGRRYN